MRSIYAMGVLAEFEAVGLKPSVDLCAGTSGGALDLAFFVAGTAEDGVDAFVSKLSGKRFINRSRVRKVIDVDYVIDDVMRPALPRLESGGSTRIPFRVGVTSFPAGRSEHFEIHDGRVEPFELLKASSAIPVLYGRPIVVNGAPYVDGGVTDPLPVLRLVLGGCTRVIAIATRPLGTWGHNLSGVERLIVKVWPGVGFGVRAAMLARSVQLDQVQSFAIRDGAEPARLSLAVIAPSDPTRLISRLTTSAKELSDFADLGRTDARRCIDSGLLAWLDVRD